MYTIGEIDVNGEGVVEAMNRLYGQLSPEKNKTVSDSHLSHAGSRYLVFGARVNNGLMSDDLVSMAILSFVHTSEKCFGQVHDVVTDEAHRGRQFGRKMSLAEEVMRILIEEARMRQLAYLELTSRPDRDPANKLYQRLGFELVSQAVKDRGTNWYRLHLG